MTRRPKAHRPLVAVVGVGTLTPGAAGFEALWSDVRHGVDRITEVPADRWLLSDHHDPDPTAQDRTYGARGGFLDPQSFDVMRFGMPPRVLASTDSAQLLVLLVAQEVMEAVERGDPGRIDRARTSVVLGATGGQELANEMSGRMGRPRWIAGMRAAGIPEDEVQEAADRIAGLFPEWTEATFPGLLGNVIAGRIANRLDLGGTNCVLDAACASSHAALSLALYELYSGDSDLVITGGVDTINDPHTFMCFSKTPALSPSGDCRPFSASGDGTMLAEGVALLALKRLEDAEQDGDPIHAVIRAVGSASDGRHKSIYAPRASGQARALRNAYDKAGVDPATVELVEAHGTGTMAGDATEIEGLRIALGDEGAPCALGSVKSQIGHAKAAAGAVGLAKAVGALQHGVLPPTLKVDQLHPALTEADTRYYVNTDARPWIRGSGHPRRAGVSAFGFGGTDFHVVLEEYTGPHRAPRQRATHGELFVWSASSPDALAARLDEAGRTETPAFRWRAWASQRSAEAAARHRVAIVARDTEELHRRIEHVEEHLIRDPASPLSAPGVHYAVDALSGGIGLIFPGQGSQRVGMGADVAMTWPAALAVWDAVADLPMEPGGPLHRVVFPEPAFDEASRARQEELLLRSEWAQPGLVTTCAALLAVLRAAGVRADACAGHSLGEVTALLAAGAYDLETAVRLGRRRGELCTEAAAGGDGAMTAARADRATVEPLVPEGVVVANENSPTQTVLSGPRTTIERAERALAEAGVDFKRLAVATAFHSPMVAEATEGLRRTLAEMEVGPPDVAVYEHTTGAPYPSDPDGIRETLAGKLEAPVRFVRQIEAMYEAGIRTFVEVGPGHVLTRLVGEILGDRSHAAIPTDRRGAPGDLVLQEALGRLFVLGHEVGFEALWDGHASPRDPATRPEPKLAVAVDGGCYDRPYPPPGGQAALPAPNPPRRAPATASPPRASRPAASPPARDDDLVRAHVAWLQTMERSFEALGRARDEVSRVHEVFLRGGDDVAARDAGSLSPREGDSMSPAADRVSLRSSHTARVPAPSASRHEERSIPEPPATPDPTPAPASRHQAPSPTPSAHASGDPVEQLLAVVAEATGYPADLLELDMALEADLGIDSIKRVEILSMLRERSPGLPEVDNRRLAELDTLRQIVDYIQGAGPGDPPATGAPASAEEPSSPPLGRWEVRFENRPAPGTCPVSLVEAGTVFVTPDGDGVAEALVERLRARGAEAEVVSRVPEDARAVVFLGGLRPETGPDEAREVALEALDTARTLAPRVAEEGGLLVTVQDTGGDFGLRGSERAWLGHLAGLAKTARAEWPGATVRALDIERGDRAPEAVAIAVLDEILGGGSTPEVGLDATGRRGVPVPVPARLSQSAGAPLGEGDVVVVSGGARGVTAACVIALAEETGARFLLLGRTPLASEPEVLRGIDDEASLKQALLAAEPDLPLAEVGRRVQRVLALREVRSTLAAVDAAGGTARYATCDITDGARLARVLDEVRDQWGPVTAVLHGAGVLADRPLADKTDAGFARVFDTKVGGLRALLAATAQDPLRALILFSSVAARTGNAGQADYAMANEVLNKVAAAEARERGDACVVRALGWGPWDGGMVDASLARLFATRGIPLIPVTDGAARLVREIGAPGPAEVILGADPARFRPEDDAAWTWQVVVDRVSHPGTRSAASCAGAGATTTDQ